MSKLSRILFVFIAFGFIGLTYASFIEPFRLTVKEWHIETEKWQGRPPLKIALIADTHARVPWMTPLRLEEIIQETNALKPDLILLLGDYVGTHHFGFAVSADEGTAPFDRLSAPCGVFAVLGNHDKEAGWAEAMRKLRTPLLENDARYVNCHGRRFWVAGLKDQWWQDADMAQTIDKITTRDPVLLMMHEPDLFVHTPDLVALTVAGHMHQGQVRLPFIGSIEATLPSRYGKRFEYGHIRENGKDLVVSGGLGMAVLPIRFLAPPEITIVYLK